MDKKAERKHLDEYSHLETLLDDINRFVNRHSQLNYIDFDYYAVHDLTLFSVEPDFDFQAFEKNITRISKAVPSIKRIFSKPIIALKDISEILPVEIVAKTNQDTFSYLGTHMNQVSNITKRGIKPRKLLTQIYEDDYGIYENLVFCDFIDELLKYCRKNLKALQCLLYASETMEFNLLERINHLDYFLALGELHTGYIRDFTKHYGIAKELSRKTLAVIDSIKPRLHKPIYQRNLRRGRKLPLKKSNIFLMQKDYHSVYTAYKYLLSNRLVAEEERKEVDFIQLRKDYYSFVEIMLIFSLGHFSFQSDPEIKMNLKDLDAVFTFKKWEARIKNLNNSSFLLTLKKDKIYKILFLPTIDFTYDPSFLLTKKGNADEVIVCTPFENDSTLKYASWISIENIDSFRRIQQFILKAMIYSDTERDDCPFCGDRLRFNEDDNSYECDNCRTIIKEDTCSEFNEKYFYTEIEGYTPKTIDASLYRDEDEWLLRRKEESIMCFRNITETDTNGDSVCPICHHVHNSKKKMTI